MAFNVEGCTHQAIGRLPGVEQQSYVDASGPHKGHESSAPSAPQEVSILHLLGTVPSPARKFPEGRRLGSQPKGVPCSPPPHSPSVFAAPAAPPPPPLAPVMDCEGGTSYRDRLRAGGQGAFQRAFNVGLMPKSMKNEWNAPRPAADVQCVLSQQSDMQHGMFTTGMEGADAQQNWNGAGHNYWYVPMEQPQMLPMEQASMEQPNVFAMEQPMMFGMEQPQMSPQCPYMQQPVVQLPPQALSQAPLLQQCQAQTPTSTVSTEATPTEIERCMAIIMPQSAQFPCDKELMAAQLKAAADCQCYED